MTALFLVCGRRSRTSRPGSCSSGYSYVQSFDRACDCAWGCVRDGACDNATGRMAVGDCSTFAQRGRAGGYSVAADSLGWPWLLVEGDYHLERLGLLRHRVGLDHPLEREAVGHQIGGAQY